MSAIAAVQADGYYHPPDWDPQKESRRKHQKSKGSNQYEKHGVIRFELPYNAWCLGCERHLGRGTRFNAKKSKEGKYFTTQIWSFAMKCPTCPQRFVIETDPKNADYAFRAGIKRNEAHVEHVREDQRSATEGTIALDSEATRMRLAKDPIFRLEKAADDARIATARQTTLERLSSLSNANHRDNYEMNRALRRTNRARRGEVKRLLADGKACGLPYALPATTEADRRAAGAVRFKRSSGKETRGAALASARARARARAAPRPSSSATLAGWDGAFSTVARSARRSTTRSLGSALPAGRRKRRVASGAAASTSRISGGAVVSVRKRRRVGGAASRP